MFKERLMNMNNKSDFQTLNYKKRIALLIIIKYLKINKIFRQFFKIKID